jgi:hypothetical protein
MLWKLNPATLNIEFCLTFLTVSSIAVAAAEALLAPNAHMDLNMDAALVSHAYGAFYIT